MKATTTEATSFWDAFSPYMDFLENVLGINLDNLGPIIPLIKSPILVVGAGQGLLVSELQQRGFKTEGIDLSPEMVAGAQKRRGLKLFLGNANHMPFEKGQFKTSIVATGVIDFLEDSDQIGAIIKEVRRVTDFQGEMFVALFGFTPQFEELARYIGVIADDKFNVRRLMQIVWGPKSPPREIFALIRKDPGKNIPGLMFRALRGFMSMRKRASARIKAVRGLRKQVKRGEIKNPNILLDYVPERLFIRSSKQIHELFVGLNFPPRKIFVFDNCKIAQL